MKKTPLPEPVKQAKAKPPERKSSASSIGSASYRANFLWPHARGSIKEAGYEFANARTEAYRQEWWKELLARVRGSSPNDAGERLAPRQMRSEKEGA